MYLTQVNENTATRFREQFPVMLSKATQLAFDTLTTAFEWIKDELLAGNLAPIIGRTFAVNDFGDDHLIVVGRHGLVVYTSEWVVIRLGGYAEAGDVLTEEHWQVLEQSLIQGRQPRTIVDIMDILVSGNDLASSTIPPKNDMVLNCNQPPWYHDKGVYCGQSSAFSI